MTKYASFTLYPPGASTRRRVEERFGPDCEHIDLAGLRRLPVLDMIRKLRALRVEMVVIPADKPTEKAMAEVLKIVAAIAPARRRVVFHGDGTLENFSQIGQSLNLAGLVSTSIGAMLAHRKAEGETAALLKAPRIPVASDVDLKAPNERAAVYLYGTFTPGIEAGGSYGHIAGVANALMDRGYGLEYFFVDDGPLVRDTAHRHRIPAPRILALPLELNFHLTNARNITVMLHDVSHEKHLFIYQRLSLGNYAGAVVSREKNIPLVVEYNGSEVWASEHWGSRLRYPKVSQQAEDATLRHAHLIVTISEPLRDELIARGIDPRRIVTYPNGVDADVFDPAAFPLAERTALRAELNLAPDDCVATFIGTFGLWHGAEVMAAAIADLVKTSSETLRALKLKFLYVGDGLTMAQVKETLSDPRCAEFVRFAGRVPQKEGPRYLSVSDMFIAPHVPNADGSKFFGSPTKLFEYMAMAKGIVASKLDQIGDVLMPGIAVGDTDALAAPAPGDKHLAVMTEPGNAGDLAKAMLFLARSPEWRDHLGRNARAEAVAKYTWDAHVDKILAGLDAMPRP